MTSLRVTSSTKIYIFAKKAFFNDVIKDLNFKHNHISYTDLT